MKNRDRYILKVNEYDMLIKIQENIMDTGYNCILDGITGKKIKCPEEMRGKVGAMSRLEVCGNCIQKWLNEEG